MRYIIPKWELKRLTGWHDVLGIGCVLGAPGKLTISVEMFFKE